MGRSGIADLPLHGGSVPRWLADRMTLLGTAIAENIVHHYGVSALLSRLADPFWFQALGSVMGMDWHSSGITTSVLGALKRGLNPRTRELGIYVCGGRGRHSRQTPAELLRYADGIGLNGDSLVRSVVWRHASTTTRLPTASNFIFTGSLLPQVANGRLSNKE